MTINKGTGQITLFNFTIYNMYSPGGSSISAYPHATVDNYANLEVNNMNFIQNHAGVGSAVRNNKGNATAGTKTNITIKITTEKGTPLDGKITIKTINNTKTINAKDGKATTTLTIPITQAQKNTTITATYQGNTYYNNKTITTTYIPAKQKKHTNTRKHQEYNNRKQHKHIRKTNKPRRNKPGKPTNNNHHKQQKIQNQHNKIRKL